MSLFFFAIAFALALRANATNQAPRILGEQCTISGRVLSAANGEPLMDATVTMDAVGVSGKGRGFSTTTDAAGQFAIRNVEPGKYHLVAGHSGFVDGTYGPHPEPSGLLVVMPGETNKDVSFWLEPDGVISGHVYDEDGKPAEHVLVRAWSYGYGSLDGHDWFPSLMMRPADETDRGGRFVIRDLRPGSYI